MKTKISVVVPVYNVESYLEKCIKSIVNQTYKELEIILVDDGSTDKSGQICDKWEKIDNRIKVIHKSNGGLSDARNFGIDAATSEYIGFVDSDDYIELDMYEIMIESIMRNNADIAVCGRYLESDESIKEVYTLSEERCYNKYAAAAKVLHLKEIDVAAWDKLYKREIFKEIRYPKGRISEDDAIIYKILDITKKIVHVGKPLYHYIYRSEGISKRPYDHRRFDVYTNCIENISYISENFPEFKNDIISLAVLKAAFVLRDLQVNKSMKNTFNEDYKKFYALLKNGFLKLMVNKNYGLKNKLMSIMVLLKIYPLYYKIFKK